MARQRFIRYLLIWYFGLVKLITGQCQVGSTECITISRYTGSQYATCLTNAYIQTSSKNRHLCVDRASITCWYQCMIESYDKNEGEVYEECSCDINTDPHQDDLPAECYSPDGTDCNWYTNCLERRYPCGDHPATYAVDFAKRFCTLYGDYYSRFSARGKAWVNAVRKCLQVKLVPSLRPGQEKTCSTLKDFAFATHEACYLSPDGGSNSICDLPVSDFKQVFWTLKEGFGDLWTGSKSKFASALLPTFGQMFSVGIRCGKNWGFDAVEITVEITKPFFDNFSDKFKEWFSLRKRRSVTSIEDVVFDVTNQISHTMQWERKNIMSFGYPFFAPNTSNTQNPKLKVRIVLDPVAMYDLSASNKPTANVSAAIDDLSTAIATGALKFDLGSDTKATIFKVCLACVLSEFEGVPINITAEEKNKKEGGLSTVALALIGCGIMFIALVIIAAVWKFRKYRK